MIHEFMSIKPSLNFTFDSQVGDFQTYGYDWITQFPEPDNYSTSVKHKLFPKMVACEIKR